MTRRRSGKHRRHPVPEQPDGPPTVVSLEWDHAYPSVIADRTPGVVGVDLLDPAQLGLSVELAARLELWLERQEALSGAWIRDEPPETEEERRLRELQHRDLLTLAYDVQRELGPDVEVLLHDRPLKEQRRSWWT